VAVVSWHVHTPLERFAAAPTTAGAAVASEPIGPKRQVLVGGLVIDTGTCDVAALEKIGFPVWSRAISARIRCNQRSVALTFPSFAREWRFARVTSLSPINDGVIVVPAADIADTLAAAEKRQAKRRQETAETGIRLGLDLYEMRPARAKAGLRYVKKLEEL
jgi:4-hydroxy-4-methyl-2-oxoglutarate aldolase